MRPFFDRPANLLKILPSRLAQGRIAQDCRRVVCRHDQGISSFKPLSVVWSHFKVRINNPVGCRQSQQHHKPGAHYGELLPQPWQTCLHFLHIRSSIARRPAFNNVRDIHRFARQFCCQQDLIQKLPGFAHKRPSQFILSLSRPFPNKHHRRIKVPLSEHHPTAPCAQAAICTRFGFLLQSFEVIYLCFPYQIHLRPSLLNITISLAAM